MAAKPILFNGEMVRALLDGRKTMTRRIVGNRRVWASDIIQDVEVVDGKEKSLGFEDASGKWRTTESVCPYGQPGDLLWVRETWLPDPPIDGTWDDVSFSDGEHFDFSALPERYRLPEHVFFKTTSIYPDDWKWKPSIHMPKWASRLTLKITDVRVERLQDVSEEDAWFEGCEKGEATDNGGYFPAEQSLPDGSEIGWDCAKDWFADLWDSINGSDSWDENPWVWVVSFEVIHSNVLEVLRG